MRTVSSISNIDLHYAREPQNPYGSPGRSANFLIDDYFFAQLQACFNELFEHCPQGLPNIITCAGIYVDKPNSQHRFGRAFDLDACFWEDYNLITNNFYHDYELYLGIESFLRKHFGIVLNHYYNNAHKDHWHIDNSATVSFKRNQRSKVLYIQLVLSYIYDTPVEIDGVWGPQTSEALAYILNELTIVENIETDEAWLQFLTKTGKICFRLFERDKNPKRLLNDTYSIVLDTGLNQDDRLSILNALNNFRNHIDTLQWLGNYEMKAPLSEIIDGLT